jgi:ribosome biogenesis GTPase / thiamine phosphate phosphatase
MTPRRKKGARHKDLTDDFLSGTMEEDRLHATQRFNRRNKFHQANKTARTALLRLAEAEESGDADSLPVGRVKQVHSLHIDVEWEGQTWLCVVRRTLAKTSDTAVVVGDRVRFRDVTTQIEGDPSQKQGVIESVEDRRTLLTRSDSFDPRKQDPIIANADQMLIVVSLLLPRVKWGLIDRMLVAAKSGGLVPIVCLNKFDLAEPGADPRIRPKEAAAAKEEAEVALAHLSTGLGIVTVRASTRSGEGIEALREMMRNRATVLAGHSGVGKSSLVSAIHPAIQIRTADVSNYNQKGRHTTTSARLYDLPGGGCVIDTPGIRRFGVWNVTPENLSGYFPDVTNATAPDWRVESYQRILESLEEIRRNEQT